MSELYTIKQETLTEIANAVRTKKGTTAAIAVSDLAREINSISTGGGTLNLQEKTVTFDEESGGMIVMPDSGYNGLSKLTIESKWITSKKVISSYSYNGVSRGSFQLTAAERNALLNGRGKIRLQGNGAQWNGEWTTTYYGYVTDPDSYDFDISMASIAHFIILTNISDSVQDYNFTLYFGVLSNGRCIYIGGEDAYGNAYTNANIDSEDFFTRGDTVTIS
jgi:hypothetical protein